MKEDGIRCHTYYVYVQYAYWYLRSSSATAVLPSRYTDVLCVRDVCYVYAVSLLRADGSQIYRVLCCKGTDIAIISKVYC